VRNPETIDDAFDPVEPVTVARHHNVQVRALGQQRLCSRNQVFVPLLVAHDRDHAANHRILAEPEFGAQRRFQDGFRLDDAVVDRLDALGGHAGGDQVSPHILAYRDHAMRDPAIGGERTDGQCEMAGSDHQRRTHESRGGACDKAVVTAMGIEHVKRAAPQQRLDSHRRAHIGCAPHASVVHLETRFRGTHADARIVRTHEFDCVPAFP
jgi:hypothetical protein